MIDDPWYHKRTEYLLENTKQIESDGRSRKAFDPHAQPGNMTLAAYAPSSKPGLIEYQRQRTTCHPGKRVP